MNPETADQIIALVAIIGFILFTWFAGDAFLRRRKQEEITATPVTQEGLEQFDDLPAGVAVVMAWSEAGENPVWHHKMQNEVRSQMPVLGRALDRMVDE